ncbi:MAG: alpha/beta fold hydrolase [Rhodocyclaceae bacterium]|nr:alpha/beta fold hydrolase [Rhodocyclaceae bacterium]
MAEPLNWEREGRDWPNREASQFIVAGSDRLRWHVQTMPRKQDATKPTVLLVHGTGAATHSWRGVMPLLAAKFNVIAVDLPGHGFSESPRTHGFSLPQMAASLSALLKAMSVAPQIVVGHSAGAAILARMCLDKMITPQHLVSLNGALLPLSGLAGEVFSPIAKVLSRSSFVPKLFAWRASDPQILRRLLDGTGSRIDAAGAALYGALIGNAQHAAAALEMMAQWDLRPLAADLPKLSECGMGITLVVGENDKTVSPNEANKVKLMLPKANIVRLPAQGHLAHEESPQQTVELIMNLRLSLSSPLAKSKHG